jgi:uracil-DNA glycosylase family protein
VDPEKPAAGKLPQKADIDACRGCDLWKRATQGVAGEGSRKARLMLVGEQPGDEEDKQGKPFVGPAGKLLRRCLDEAGIAPADFYLTNAVKHFSWEPRGTRRIHKTPAQREIAACREWLDRELASVRPAVIVALGATALRAITGARVTITAARETELHHPHGARIIATYHPSAVLRAPDDDARAKLMQVLVNDLKRAAALAAEIDAGR